MKTRPADPAAIFHDATAALSELNAAAARVSAAREALETRLAAQIADQQGRIDELLTYQNARLDRTIADCQRTFADRIAQLDASFHDQLDELGNVHMRAAAAAHLACERAVENARAAGRLAAESAQQTITALEEEIAARVESVLTRLRRHAAESAADAALHLTQSREADDTLRTRLEQAAQVADLLDRRLAEILGHNEQGAPPQAAKPPLRRAA